MPLNGPYRTTVLAKLATIDGLLDDLDNETLTLQSVSVNQDMPRPVTSEGAVIVDTRVKKLQEFFLRMRNAIAQVDGILIWEATSLFVHADLAAAITRKSDIVIGVCNDVITWLDHPFTETVAPEWEAVVAASRASVIAKCNTIITELS